MKAYTLLLFIALLIIVYKIKRILSSKMKCPECKGDGFEDGLYCIECSHDGMANFL